MSKLDATRVLMLGHAAAHLGGESIQVKKFSSLLNGQIEEVIDLFQLFGEEYEPLAKLNYALAESGEPPLFDVERARSICQKLDERSSHNLLMLSFSSSLAALLATGIQKKRRLISKFYVHHPSEKVFSALYEPVNLLLTESLLGNLRGAAYGIPESKLLYFPHHYPEIELPEKAPTKEVVIGVISRFERGKNCECALEVCRRLVERGLSLKLILMGDFATHTSDPTYQENFARMLAAYEEAPWFTWEREVVPYPAALHHYNRFDLCLQLSGSEAGSNIIVELLGIGKPVIALNASTNPYLFSGGALLVEKEPKIYSGQLNYEMPDMDLLEGSVEALVQSGKLRKEWGKKGKELARKRFHRDVLKERIPLLFESDRAKVQKLYDQDRKAYGF
ncbi:MAG: glycosyltransferase [Chlamydiales bacterium]|nr:glycosyltransferase [Chlamydiales bacterium]